MCVCVCVLGVGAGTGWGALKDKEVVLEIEKKILLIIFALLP